MKIFTIIVFVFVALYPINAQDEVKFKFTDNQGALDISSVDTEVKEHPMGREIALKLELLKSRFTYIEPGSPTSPGTKTIILKPNIYNSINKLNRYFKKEIRNENIQIDSAKNLFLPCLNAALILYAEDTDEFESYLKKIKEPEQIIETYHNIVFE